VFPMLSKTSLQKACYRYHYENHRLAVALDEAHSEKECKGSCVASTIESVS
jgi:hypothetical protein